MTLRLFQTETERGQLQMTQMEFTKPRNKNDDVEVVSNGDRKRPAADDTNGVHKAKKQKVDDDDDDVVICEVEENGKAATPVKKASPPPAEDGVICIE